MTDGNADDHNDWPKEEIKKFMKEVVGKYSSTWYYSPFGWRLIGWSHYTLEITKDEITEQEAEEFLEKDYRLITRVCQHYLKVRLNQNQNIALVSFAFDIGPTNFIKSKFLERLNSGEDPVKVAEEEMYKWVYVTIIGSNG